MEDNNELNCKLNEHEQVDQQNEIRQNAPPALPPPPILTGQNAGNVGAKWWGICSAICFLSLSVTVVVPLGFGIAEVGSGLGLDKIFLGYIEIYLSPFVLIKGWISWIICLYTIIIFIFLLEFFLHSYGVVPLLWSCINDIMEGIMICSPLGRLFGFFFWSLLIWFVIWVHFSPYSKSLDDEFDLTEGIGTCRFAEFNVRDNEMPFIVSEKLESSLNSFLGAKGASTAFVWGRKHIGKSERIKRVIREKITEKDSKWVALCLSLKEDVDFNAVRDKVRKTFIQVFEPDFLRRISTVSRGRLDKLFVESGVFDSYWKKVKNFTESASAMVEENSHTLELMAGVTFGSFSKVLINVFSMLIWFGRNLGITVSDVEWLFQIPKLKKMCRVLLMEYRFEKAVRVQGDFVGIVRALDDINRIEGEHMNILFYINDFHKLEKLGIMEDIMGYLGGRERDSMKVIIDTSDSFWEKGSGVNKMSKFTQIQFNGLEQKAVSKVLGGIYDGKGLTDIWERIGGSALSHAQLVDCIVNYVPLIYKCFGSAKCDFIKIDVNREALDQVIAQCCSSLIKTSEENLKGILKKNFQPNETAHVRSILKLIVDSKPDGGINLNVIPDEKKPVVEKMIQHGILFLDRFEQDSRNIKPLNPVSKSAVESYFNDIENAEKHKVKNWERDRSYQKIRLARERLLKLKKESVGVEDEITKLNASDLEKLLSESEVKVEIFENEAKENQGKKICEVK